MRIRDLKIGRTVFLNKHGCHFLTNNTVDLNNHSLFGVPLYIESWFSTEDQQTYIHVFCEHGNLKNLILNSRHVSLTVDTKEPTMEEQRAERIANIGYVVGDKVKVQQKHIPQIRAYFHNRDNSNMIIAGEFVVKELKPTTFFNGAVRIGLWTLPAEWFEKVETNGA